MNTLRAAYQFLKGAAFFDVTLPRLSLRISRMQDWGDYCNEPPAIRLSSRIRNGHQMLRILAHEMVHAALDKHGAWGKADHGKEFKALARIVCTRMGWPERGF